MNWETNPHMVGYKLKKFAPLGVKERHQAVEKKRQGKKRPYEKKCSRYRGEGDKRSRETNRQTGKQTNQ